MVWGVASDRVVTPATPPHSQVNAKEEISILCVKGVESSCDVFITTIIYRIREKLDDQERQVRNPVEWLMEVNAHGGKDIE
jgi:hypothetical protein